MARQKKPINWDTVKRKMEIGCSAKEIWGCEECFVSDDTFYARFKEEFGSSFSDYSDRFHQGGKGNIKVMQYQKAMTGNWQALQWLGKTELGQKEPENIQMIPPHEDSLALRHENMILKSQIEKLLNANKPETE